MTVDEKEPLLGHGVGAPNGRKRLRNPAEQEDDIPQQNPPSGEEHREVRLQDTGEGSGAAAAAAGAAAGVEHTNVIYGTTQEVVPPTSYLSITGGPPTITCKVCEELIDISGKRDQHVVKCQRCGEATPIKSAPPGRKYVRCQCKCLLICKTTSSRIACPRADCDVVINFIPVGPPINPALNADGHSRIQCAYCHDTFLFDAVNNSFANCPHCKRISSIRGNYSRKRGGVYAALGVMLLIVSIAVTAGTAKFAKDKGGLYLLYIVMFVASLALMLRGGYFLTLRRSHIQPDATTNNGFNTGTSSSSNRGGGRRAYGLLRGSTGGGLGGSILANDNIGA